VAHTGLESLEQMVRQEAGPQVEAVAVGHVIMA